MGGHCELSLSMTGAQTATSSRIRLPYPHPGQQVVQRQARRFNWLEAGRRWRKTTLAMSISVQAAASGLNILWGAPTYGQVRIGMDETRYAAGEVAAFNTSRMEAVFPSGGRIMFRSLDNPDNARGHTADGIVIDEAADVMPAAWYEVLRPMLIDTNGWLWAIGTPKGRNWLYQEHVAAAGRDDSRAWQVPTLGVEVIGGQLVRKVHPLENPNIPLEEIERLFQTMPERVFRQEILAEFVEGGAGIIRFVGDAISNDLPQAWQESMTIVGGLDWAFSTDFTWLILLDAATGNVVHSDRFNGIDYAVQRGRIAAACRQWRAQVVLGEQNSMGKPNNDELRRMGVPVRDFTTTNATKADIIESLAAAFEHGRIRIPNDPVLRAELESIEGTRTPGGMTSYAAPSGLHDDGAMSLALAWAAVGRSPEVGVSIWN